MKDAHVIEALLLSFLFFFAGSLGPAHAAVPGTDFARAWKADRVLVVKSERRLYLVRDYKVIGSYRVALGPQPVGHKVFEGDGRTPEGLYVLDRKQPDSRFYRAIHISYPSALDVAEARKYGGRPGGLVMIHGQPSNGLNGYHDYRPWDWTAGCIALSNAEMDEIWNATDEGTPIEILP
jgi:murein L,D-transpeptidase YafK